MEDEFWEAFPSYLAIGCSYEEYWYGDPRIAPAYLKAFKIRQSLQNESLWLQGAYNFQAVSTALSNFHLDGKRHKPNEYLKEPFKFDEPKPVTKADVQAQKEAFVASMKAQADAWNRQYKGK